MKYILILFLLIASSHISKANSPVRKTYAELLATTAFSTATTYELMGRYARGDGGGGMYAWVDTSTAIYDSVLFIRPNNRTAAQAGRFILLHNGSVDAKQAGVRFDVVNGVGTDDYPFWNALFSSAGINGFAITAPAEQSYSAQTITITRPIKFIGGIGWNPKNSTQGQAGYTEISFPQNTTGIRHNFSTDNRGSSYFENIVVAAGHTTLLLNQIDETKHGWHINAVTRFKNCGGIGFAGSGFFLWGNNNADINLWTDVSFSRLDDCFGHNNRRHGLEIEGADASGMTMVNFKGNGNGGNAIHDIAFLSNTYITPNGHSNSSPDVAWQRSLCKYNGKVWTALRSGVLGTPIEGSADWVDMRHWWKGEYQFIYTSVLTNTIVEAYDASRVYLTGGAFNIAAEVPSVNTAVVIGGYTECDQPPSAFGINVLVVHAQVCFIRGNAAVVSGQNGSTASAAFRAATKNGSATLNWMGIRMGEKNNTNLGATIMFDTVKKAIMFGDAITQGAGGLNDTTFQPSLFTNGPYFGNYYTPPESFGRTTLDEVNAIPFSKRIGLTSDGVTYKQIGFAAAAPTTGTWLKNDFLHYDGTATDILGYKCTAGGTPGTWVICKIYLGL